MRLALRETGSILVHAPRSRVFEVLRREMAAEPGLRETPSERIESHGAFEESTFVLRDAPGGTRLYHSRSRGQPFIPHQGSRDKLRAAVEAELLRVQRLAQDST